MLHGECREAAVGDDPSIWAQVGEVFVYCVGYGNFLGVSAGDVPGVEAQIGEDDDYFVGDVKVPGVGGRDGPALGTQFGEVVACYLSVGAGIG